MAPRLQVGLDESIPPLAAIVEERVSRPFRDAALDLLARGLAVIPCGGADGKVPLVEWGKWTKRPGRAFIEKMMRRYPSANVGIVVGLSGITVVDCDDPAAVAVMVARCGDTPLKVRTPGGGVHLYYRAAGERCADLRPEGLKVDVKSIGGFVVAPPSVRPDGPHAGRAYEFLEGSWHDLPRLPAVRPGSLSMVRDGAGRPTRLRAIKQGRRNNTLFRLLLRQARYCDSFDALLDIAEGFNQDLDPPLSAAEVADAARSAWGYEERGENWAGREPRVSLTRSQYEALLGHEHGADACFLLPKLRFSHWDRDRFAAVPKAMAADKVIPGWGHQRYRDALKALVDVGMLTVTHQGGGRIGDARQYAFGTCLAKGTGTGPNITRHPPLSPERASSSAQGACRRLAAVSRRRPAEVVQLDWIELLGGPPAPRRAADPVLFGSTVRDARITRNLTQAQTAALAGISRSALGNIETGTFPAGLGTQVRLAAALGLLSAA